MKDFRDLSVWQKAHRATLDIYGTSKSFPREEQYELLEVFPQKLVADDGAQRRKDAKGAKTSDLAPLRLGARLMAPPLFEKLLLAKLRAECSSSGFTLIEVVVTAAILALVMGVAVIPLTSVSRAELRQSAGSLSGLIRATYDEAALSGENQRLVFDFTASSISAESMQTLGDEAAQTAEESAPEAYSAWPKEAHNFELVPKEENGEPTQPGLLEAFLGVGQGLQKNQRTGFVSTGKSLALGEDVKLLDVWTDALDKPATEGKAYLQFFSFGYTQDAVIHLQDSEARIFAVRVSALTGKTEIFDEYTEH